MAYDVHLADRVRELLVGSPVTEQKMFGGLAFLVAGKMTVAASSQGGLWCGSIPHAPTDSSRPPTGGRW